PGKVLVRTAQAVEHLLFLCWQLGDDAMEEDRGLVEQSLRRFDAFDDDAAGHSTKLSLFFRGELTPGEYHDGHITQGRIGAHLAQNFEARHVRQAEVEYDTVAGFPPHCRESIAACAGGDNLDIIMAEEFGHRKLLGGVVLDDDQALAASLDIFFYADQSATKRLEGCGFGDERKRSPR